MTWYLDKLRPSLPVLETQRLLLRPMERKDAADMYEYARLQETTRYLLWNPHPSVEYTRAYLTTMSRLYRKGQFFDWAVVEKATGKMIGTCGFARLEQNHRIGEIGYVLNPAYHGRKIATEAASAVIRYGFETLGLNRIEGRYMVENVASRRVMEHCGMTLEGVLRQSMMVKGRFRDIGLCSLLLADYQAREAARCFAATVN